MWTSGQFAEHLARERGSAALWRQRIQPQMRAAVRHSLAAAAVRALSAANPNPTCPATEARSKPLIMRDTTHTLSDTDWWLCPAARQVRPANAAAKAHLADTSSFGDLQHQPEYHTAKA